jgi:hypothetical protein
MQGNEYQVKRNKGKGNELGKDSKKRKRLTASN